MGTGTLDKWLIFHQAMCTGRVNNVSSHSVLPFFRHCSLPLGWRVHCQACQAKAIPHSSQEIEEGTAADSVDNVHSPPPPSYQGRGKGEIERHMHLHTHILTTACSTCNGHDSDGHRNVYFHNLRTLTSNFLLYFLNFCDYRMKLCPLLKSWWAYMGWVW